MTDAQAFPEPFKRVFKLLRSGRNVLTRMADGCYVIPHRGRRIHVPASTVDKMIAHKIVFEKTKDGQAAWALTSLGRALCDEVNGAPRPTRQPSYADAIQWVAENDDTTFLDEEYGVPSVAVDMISALFALDETKVIEDLRKAVRRLKS